MNLAHNSSKILITGQSGQGKSTYFARFLQNSFRTIYDKIFIFDHIGELSFRLNVSPALTEEDLGQQFEQGLVCFDPSHLFPGDTDFAWNFFCEWCFERAARNPGQTKLIAVDELQMFASTAALSWEQCLVVETGRKYELDFCAISQQLNLVHNRLRNQLTEMVVFRTEDKLVLDVLEDKGFVIDRVRNLQKGQYYIKNFQTGVEEISQIDLQKENSVQSSNVPNAPEPAVSEPEPEGQTEESN